MLCPNCEKEVSYGGKMEDFVCPLCGFAAGPKPAVHAPSSGKSSFAESAAASRLFMWAFRVRIIGVVLCILLAIAAIFSAVLASQDSAQSLLTGQSPLMLFLSGAFRAALTCIGAFILAAILDGLGEIAQNSANIGRH